MQSKWAKNSQPCFAKHVMTILMPITMKGHISDLVIGERLAADERMDSNISLASQKKNELPLTIAVAGRGRAPLDRKMR